eukprot:scaffold47_cov112-Isochrysis_galbana.AAC.11
MKAAYLHGGVGKEGGQWSGWTRAIVWRPEAAHPTICMPQVSREKPAAEPVASMRKMMGRKTPRAPNVIA